LEVNLRVNPGKIISLDWFKGKSTGNPTLLNSIENPHFQSNPYIEKKKLRESNMAC
jgi:hypothetical protein